MKKIFFLLLTSISSINAMEEQPEEPITSELEQTFEQWVELPEEIKQQILSFVPTPGSYRDLVTLMSTSKEMERLVNDPFFINQFVQRTVRVNRKVAVKLLVEAAKNGNVDLTKAFIDADALLKTNAGDLVLQAAHFDFSKIKADERERAKENNTLAKTLLEAGAPIPLGQKENQNALAQAIIHDNKEIVEAFIKRNVPIESEFVGGKYWFITPLMMAIRKNQYDIAKSLLEHGANPNHNTNGRTPLWWAANHASPKMVQLLLEHDVDPNTPTESERYPLTVAIRRTEEIKDVMSMVKLLLEHGAVIDFQRANGNTSLMEAIWRGNKDLIDLLLSYQPDLSLRNIYGETALDTARQLGNQDIIELLEKAEKGQTSGQ